MWRRNSLHYVKALLRLSSSIERNAHVRHGSEYASHESSRFMQKLLNKRGSKGKKKWYQSHIAEPMEVLGTKQAENKHGVTVAQRIRARQLAHVLYDKITQIVNTGELSEEILKKQVFITTVKMHPTLHGINVFWDSSRTDALEVEALLQANTGKLRSLLISYHVLGRISPITFVKDRSRGDLTLLNQRLEVADYGPDFFPPDPGLEMMVDRGAKRFASVAEKLSHDLERFNFNNETFGSTLGHSPETQCSYSQTAEAVGKNLNSSDSEPEMKNIDSGREAELKNLDSLNNESGLDGYRDPFVPPHDCDAATSADKIRDDLAALELSFRSNLYGLPRDEIMKKVLAKKSRVKHQSPEAQSGALEESPKFDIKLLKVSKDKAKLKSVTDSTKFKQRLLERDAEDFQQTSFDEESDDEDAKYIEELEDIDDVQADDDWKRK